MNGYKTQRLVARHETERTNFFDIEEYLDKICEPAFVGGSCARCDCSYGSYSRVYHFSNSTIVLRLDNDDNSCSFSGHEQLYFYIIKGKKETPSKIENLIKDVFEKFPDFKKMKR